MCKSILCKSIKLYDLTNFPYRIIHVSFRYIISFTKKRRVGVLQIPDKLDMKRKKINFKRHKYSINCISASEIP